MLPVNTGPSSLPPMAVYLIAALGALVGFLILLIFILAVAICCIRRYASKTDFSPKWYNRYFIDPNATMESSADSLKDKGRPRSQTHLTLINGQVYFWKSAGKEKRKKKVDTVPEVVEMEEIPDDTAESSRQAKAISNVYEDHKTEILGLPANKVSENKSHNIQESPEVVVHEVKKAANSASKNEGQKSRPNSSIISVNEVTSTSTDGDLSDSRKTRLESIESNSDEENTGDIFIDIASLLPVTIREPEKIEESQASPTNVSSSNTNDNKSEYKNLGSSEPLFQRSTPPKCDKKNPLSVFMIPSSVPSDSLIEQNQNSSPKKSKLRKEKRISTGSSMEDPSLVVSNIGAQPEEEQSSDESFPDGFKSPEKEECKTDTSNISSQSETSRDLKPVGVKNLVRRIESQETEEDYGPLSPNTKAADSPKTLDESDLYPTSIASPIVCKTPTPKLHRSNSPGASEVISKSFPKLQDVFSGKRPTHSKHLSVDEDIMIKKFGAIFEEKSKSVDESLGHREERSKKVSSLHVSEDSHGKIKLSKDIKKRISSFESKNPDFLTKPTGPPDVNSVQVPKIAIKGTSSSPRDKSVAHTKVSKKQSSDLHGELQKKLKESASPKVTRKEKKSSSQDKPKSPTAGKFPLLPKFWESQSFKEKSSASKLEKPDTKHAALSRKTSTPEPTETRAKQEKKPLMPPSKKTKVRRASSIDSERVYASVKVKPKQKLDESIVIGGDGYVDPRDIAGRRVGPVVPEEGSTDYRYVPVDVPQSHSGDTNIDLMPNSAYGTPNVATGDGFHFNAADEDYNNDDDDDDDQYEFVQV